MSARISASAYAALTGLHPDTVQRMCREGKLHARRPGRDWQIDVEKSEAKLSLAYGNAVEKSEELARRKSSKA